MQRNRPGPLRMSFAPAVVSTPAATSVVDRRHQRMPSTPAAQTLFPEKKEERQNMQNQVVGHAADFTPHKYLTSTDALNASATMAEWLDAAVKEGFSRFAPAFSSEGYDDIGHMCTAKASLAEIDAMMKAASVELEMKPAHIALIKMALVSIGAVSDTLSLGPMEWLEMVGRGYGARFAPAFMAAGYSTVDDIIHDCPTESDVFGLLSRAGATKPQTSIILAALSEVGGVSGQGPVVWLETVAAGFGKRFGAVLHNAGYETLEDLKRTCPSASALSAILAKGRGGNGNRVGGRRVGRAGGGSAAAAAAALPSAISSSSVAAAQPPQIDLIIAALSKLGAVSHAWLDNNVKAGYTLKFGSAFSQAGWEDEEDIKLVSPDIKTLASMMRAAGGTYPQMRRVQIELVRMTGSPLPVEPSPEQTMMMSTGARDSFLNRPLGVDDVDKARPSAFSEMFPGSFAPVPGIATATTAAAPASASSKLLRNSTSAEQQQNHPSSPPQQHQHQQYHVVEAPASAPTLVAGAEAEAKPRPVTPATVKATTADSSTVESDDGAGDTHKPKQYHHKKLQKASKASSLSSSSSPNSSLPSLKAIFRTKHAMLSYQWDAQEQVKRARKLIEAAKVPCWMDIDNMESDIYDSMAEGVQGAACVICFMSQLYQDSTNCKLELKFAQQSGVPIIPVMLTDNWRASDWLGLVTAGSLWTTLYGKEEEFDAGIQKLIVQIQRTFATSKVSLQLLASDESDFSSDDVEEEFSVTEMRDELERLKTDLQVALTHVKVRCDGSGPPAPLLASGPCPVPAGAPQLPSGLQISSEMKILLKTILSPTSSRQVGFCGMGGIGKTTISSWIARETVTRSTFERIVWATFGQTPSLNNSHAVVYLQLTGKEFQASTTAEERQQLLKTAFQGRNVLLILDDVWELEHVEDFTSWVDDTTQSKILMSSRVRGALEGGGIVDIALPSDEDAVRMLMREAGIDNYDESNPKREAHEVVKFCNRLPLAVGIAGKLLKKMSLDDDWSEVLAVLREEFGDGGTSRAMENSVIRTSLKGITGRHKKQVLQLFYAFALLPEDRIVPLEVLGALYTASSFSPRNAGTDESDGVPSADAAAATALTNASVAPPRLLIRKWLKMLIDRSLVLGTVDRPQLHDIVGEFLIGQLSTFEIKAAQKRVVNQFRADRPPETGWQTTEVHSSKKTMYIVQAVESHIELGWNDDWLNDREAIGWLEDITNGRQDAISYGAAKAIGKKKLAVLVQQAETAGQWWVAALRQSLLAHNSYREEGSKNARPLYQKAIRFVEAIDPNNVDQVQAGNRCRQYDKEALELAMLFRVLKCWDAEDLFTYGPLLAKLLQTDAAVSNPLNLADGIVMTMLFPGVAAGDMDMICQNTVTFLDLLLVASKTHEGTPLGRQCMIQCMGWTGLWFDFTIGRELEKNPKFDPGDMFGEKGSLIDKVYAAYNYESDHRNLMDTFSCDLIISSPGCNVLPLLFFWGESERAFEVFNVIHSNMQVAIASTIESGKKSDHSENQTILWFYLTMMPSLMFMGKPELAFEILKVYFVDFGNIRAAVKALSGATPMIQERSNASIGTWYHEESMVDHLKMMWLCCCPAGSVSCEEAFEGLPNAHDMFQQTFVKSPINQSQFSWIQVTEMANIYWAAAAHERFGKLDEALEYTAMVEQPLWNNRGTCTPSTNAYYCAYAKACRGGCLTALGRQDEAAAEFEAGVAFATSRGYKYVEAVVLRDWNMLIRNPNGDGVQGERQFREALSNLGAGNKSTKHLEEMVAKACIF